MQLPRERLSIPLDRQSRLPCQLSIQRRLVTNKNWTCRVPANEVFGRKAFFQNFPKKFSQFKVLITKRFRVVLCIAATVAFSCCALDQTISFNLCNANHPRQLSSPTNIFSLDASALSSSTPSPKFPGVHAPATHILSIIHRKCEQPSTSHCALLLSYSPFSADFPFSVLS